LVPDISSLKIIGVAGKAGAGKDTFYEHVLKPRGFLRWQMTLHYKVWLVATQRASWHDVFVAKPPHVRKMLQEEITQLRDDYSEEIWLETLCTWMCALKTIVGVDAPGIAVTDLRFLIEMRGIKAMGGKILHLQAPDEQANVAPELRGHRSETELDSPEVQILRDAYIFNEKDGIIPLTRQGNLVLLDWGWL
jgi:dephospho-CoA kinase